MAITKYDQFDFLIDIVPRDELKPAKKEDSKAANILGAEQVRSKTLSSDSGAKINGSVLM